MKKFLVNTSLFSLLFILATTIIATIFNMLLIKNISFVLPENKTILVVGDSQTECAIDDNILMDSFNFSQSGTAHFYSFLKVRKMLENNPQIDTVVISYSYEDVTIEKDSWVTSQRYISSKVPRYLSLMNIEDLLSIFSCNPIAVVFSIPSFIRDSVPYIFHKKNIMDTKFLGGYLHLDREKLDEDIRNNNNKRKSDISYSKYQMNYIREIYNMSILKNKTVILLNTPKYLSNIDVRYKMYYFNFAKEYLKNAKLVDHSDIKMPAGSFADINHLNFKGAEIYSQFIKNCGFN
jgi:hypothetical protein